MQQVIVELDNNRSYPIFIGQDLLQNPEILLPYITSEQVMIVTNETVAPLYLEMVRNTLNHKVVEQVVLPDGEEFKSLEYLEKIFDGMLQKHFDRHSTILALGGGVIGDMAGFAAACYQRGVPFIQVPTTLLAQVDSSVGGKTAVNHRLGKNMIGAFYQPQVVVADINTLKTLEERHLKAGLAEVIKYGFIYDKAFLVWIEENIESLLTRDSEALIYAIKRSCEIKAEVVSQDERESGIRAILNLGHTFGHAIETNCGYGNWVHGEAVAVGMLMAADMSARIGWLEKTCVERVKRLLEQSQLPVTSPEGLTPEQYLETMKLDKKVQTGKIRLVLLESLGKAVVTGDYPHEALMETLAEYCS